MVFEQGMRITPFMRPWLTMTINESCLFDGGRSVMRLTESCLKGRGEDEGMGASGVVINLVLLTCGASGNEGIDKQGEAWPPKVSFQ